MRPKRPFTLVVLGSALLALAWPPTPIRGELLYFNGGDRVQAPIRRRDGRVLVDSPAGRFTFRETDFLTIAPEGWPPREWESRRQAAHGAGIDARLAAAWWALENGLVPEAVAMLKAAHIDDPRHQPTAKLAATLARLDRPRLDPDTDLLTRALGVPCEVEQGPHVLLLHQLDPSEARRRVELLERVTTSYYLLLAAQGLDLKVPDHRLVSVHLRDQRDYLAFLDAQGAGAFRSTLGYFHPGFRAVVTFDPRTTSKARTVSHRTDEGATIPHDGDRRALLAGLELRALGDGTAAHEMIHLLVVESGLASDPGRFPLWLHEGFAAQFEVVRGGRWAGIGRAHDLRLHDWRTLSHPAELAPLIRDGGFGHGYRRDLYAKSWALVYFLRKARPRQFSAFLDLLRLPDPCAETSDPDRFEAAFRAAFGSDLQALETEWRDFMAHVQTPLEENAPRGEF